MHGREAIVLGSLCITTVDHGAPRRKGLHNAICSVSHDGLVICACAAGTGRCHARAKSIRARATQRNHLVGALPQRMKNEWNKWKNHFYEMKGDVGMSLHEKERNKKMPTQDTKSLITPSLHLCFFQDYNVHFHAGKWMSCLLCLMHS